MAPVIPCYGTCYFWVKILINNFLDQFLYNLPQKTQNAQINQFCENLRNLRELDFEYRLR